MELGPEMDVMIKVLITIISVLIIRCRKVRPATTVLWRVLIFQSIPSDEHHDRARFSSPSAEPPLLASPSQSKSATAELSPRSQGLGLSKCQDVRYESRDYIPGVSYKSVDGEEGWTPVIRRKRKTVRLRRSSESESSTSGSEVNVSCLRKVEYEKRNEIPGLNIYRRGPVEWTPIQAVTCTNPVEPIAAGLDQKLSNLRRL